MYSKLLVPMALDHGISPQTLELAEALRAEGGEIIALHVYETPQGSVSVYLDKSVVQAGFDAAEKKLQEKVEGLPNVAPKIVKGHSARTIIDFAEANGVDCIVIGSANPALSDFFLGTTASRVARHAKCAVHIQRDKT